MEVGTEVSRFLKTFGSKDLTDDQARLVSNAAAEALLGRADAEKLLGPAENSPVALQQAYAGVVSVLVEAAKHKLSSADLKGVLVDDQRLPAGRAALVTDTYEKNSAGLRAQLEKLADASPAPRLAGSSWRADYTVSTSEDRAAASMVFHVALRTTATAAQTAGAAGGAGDGEIRFAMGVEQLAALHEKLKEAIHAADSLTAAPGAGGKGSRQ